MTLVQLQILLAIADTRSFTTAAQRLQLSQSAVSHALAALEQELGVMLLERRRGGARVTAVGEQVVAHARVAVSAAAAARQTATAARGLATGQVCVGSFPSVSARLLPGVLRIFRERYPGISITLFDGTDDEVCGWIAARVVDIGVVTGPQPGYTLTPLGDDPFVVVVAPDDPLARRASLSARVLAGEPLILSKGGCEPFVRACFAAAGVALVPAYEVRDMPTILAMVRAGLGITIAPRLALPERADGLWQIPLDPPRVRQLALATLADMPLSPATQAFRDEAVRWWQATGAPSQR